MEECRPLSLRYQRPITLGLPYLIGCDMAGGNWEEYHHIIVDEVQKHPYMKVTLYCLR